MSYLNDVKRLVWRFNQPSAFRPNETDINALAGIIETCKDVEKGSVLGNKAFYKLYAHVYMKFCLYYHTTPDDKIPQKELNKLLDRSLHDIMREFAREMDLIETERCIEAGLPLNKRKVWTIKEINTNLQAQFTSLLLKERET